MISWGKNGQWCKLDAQGDKVRGPQRLKAAVWNATGATAGSDLVELREIETQTPITGAPAEAAQFLSFLLVPDGLIEGIELSDLDIGSVTLYFHERPAEKVSAKAIHDASPLVPEE